MADNQPPATGPDDPWGDPAPWTDLPADGWPPPGPPADVPGFPPAPAASHLPPPPAPAAPSPSNAPYGAGRVPAGPGAPGAPWDAPAAVPAQPTGRPSADWAVPAPAVPADVPPVIARAMARATQTHESELGGLFDDDRGSVRMMELLEDPDVQDVRCNAHDRIFYTDSNGQQMIDRIFQGPAQYVEFINRLMQLTDVGFVDLDVAAQVVPVVEGSFRPDRTSVKGSIIVVTKHLTRDEPCLVIRKQPKDLVTLDKMLEQQMMNVPMRMFLEMAIRGRLNILISGGSGAGKTTLARALSWYIDPNERVLTAEEIDELHLESRLPNVVPLTTWRDIDENGRIIKHEKLEDLVRHALRLRADRIWVGETRGLEAYALVKACLSGHDGSVTTVHANNSAQAIRQLISYVMESHLTEEVARDQVSGAFHLAVQINKASRGRRVITEIVELEAVREGNEQRRNPLFLYDYASETWQMVGNPTPRILEALARYNVNYDDFLSQLQYT